MGGSLYRRRHAYHDCGRRWDTACEKEGAVEEHQREGRGDRDLDGRSVRVLSVWGFLLG